MNKINKIYLVIGLTFFQLVSCSKKVVLSDGERTKVIKVAGEIKMIRDQNNQLYASFESTKGTKYSINTSDYQMKIK
jgi:hypothetical protein